MALRLLLFHRTVGPEYDDRIQKIFGSIVRADVAVPSAQLWERKNTARKGVFADGGSFEVLRVPFASKKTPRPGPIWSFYEIIAESVIGYLRVWRHCPAVVVVQNHRLFGLIQFLSFIPRRRYRLVWDLRELPIGFMAKESLRARYFGALLKKCDSVIVTNESRQGYMREIFGDKALNRSVVIPNYPSSEFTSSRGGPFNEQRVAEMTQGGFFYLQNPSSSGRYPWQAIDAALRHTHLAIVVSGKLDQQAKKELEAVWGGEFQERVILTGMIISEEIISLLDRCTAALVFYNWDRPNNDFCDPNRLYQAIARGAPVVVGANKGLKPIVERLGCGVATEGDGRSVQKIGMALQDLLHKYDSYRANAMKSRSEFSWATNEEKLLRAIFGDKLEATKSERGL